MKQDERAGWPGCQVLPAGQDSGAHLFAVSVLSRGLSGVRAPAGVPRRARGGGDQGQEVYEAEDGVKEDCREYHDGQ